MQAAGRQSSLPSGRPARSWLARAALRYGTGFWVVSGCAAAVSLVVTYFGSAGPANPIGLGAVLPLLLAGAIGLSLVGLLAELRGPAVLPSPPSIGQPESAGFQGALAGITGFFGGLAVLLSAAGAVAAVLALI